MTSDRDLSALTAVYPDQRDYQPAEPDGNKGYPLEIAGFWRRVVADLVDMFVLSVCLFILFLAYPSYLYSLGPHSRWYWYALSIAYFTFFNSRLGGGRTLGKRLTWIQVTDDQAQLLSVRRTLVRSMVLFSFLLPQNWALAQFWMYPVWRVLGNTLAWGGTLSLLYAYVINRSTRQGPHDLLVGSYVIEYPLPVPYARYGAPPRPRKHADVVVGLFILALVAASLAVPWGRKSEFTDFGQAVLNDDRIKSVGVSGGSCGLDIWVWYGQDCEQTACESVSFDTVQKALVHIEQLEKHAVIRVRVFKAIDLGWAKSYHSLGSAETTQTGWYDYLVPYYNDRGQAFAGSSDYPEAVESFTRAIELCPGCPEAYENRALAYNALEEYELALNDAYAYRDYARNRVSTQWRQFIAFLERKVGETVTRRT